MKNVLKVFTLIIIVGVVLQGCSNTKTDNVSSNQRSTSIPQDNKDVQKNVQEVVEKDVKRVGKPNYGFVDIPSSWVPFKDVDVSQPIMQYSDLTGKSIITLNSGKNVGNDAKTVASGIWKNMESEGAQDIVGATVKLGSNTAFQVYGQYPKEDIMLVAWVFEANDGYLYYVSVESPKDSIMDLVHRTERSFSIEK